MSANGNQSGTAIVWATHSTAGSAETIAQPGELHAYNARNIATELWNSLQNAARDDTGRYGKFNPPTVVNGKVYLGTFSEQLDIYGLLSLPVAPGQTVFTTQAPKMPNQTDNVSYEMGTKFTAALPGQITGIRYWKAPSETGSHAGTIWSSTGTPLATVAFTNETASGWQQAIFSAPVSIGAKTWRNSCLALELLQTNYRARRQQREGRYDGADRFRGARRTQSPRSTSQKRTSGPCRRTCLPRHLLQLFYHKEL